MGFKNFCEQTSKKLVIVDIQPAYSKAIYFMEEFAQFVPQYDQILNLYVGELSGDTKQTIAKFYYQNRVPKEIIYKMRWFDKGYAFFRDMMDARMCYMRDDIVRLVRFMIRKKVNDSRELTQLQVAKLKIPDYTYDKLEDYYMGIPNIRWILPKWNGCDICGGGLNECLEEVLILADALKLQYNVVNQFVYGQ